MEQIARGNPINSLYVADQNLVNILVSIIKDMQDLVEAGERAYNELATKGESEFDQEAYDAYLARATKGESNEEDYLSRGNKEELS